jgi:hypothetical protein
MEKQEPPVSEKTTIKMPEAELVSEYHPESEEALINYVNGQNSKLEVANILVKWEIGRCINSFYQGKYGDHELKNISKATGINRDSLNKMIKFAKQYNREQLEMVLRGKYVMSWNGIAQNLTVETSQLIGVYKGSDNIGEFHRSIMNLKKPNDPSKLIKSAGQKDAEEPMIVAPEIIPEESIPAEYDEPADDIDPDELARHYGAYEKELEMLKAENEGLKKEILSKDIKARELEKALSDAQREKEKYEDLSYTYMHKLDKIRAGLENNTPARAILEWLDQGDNE